MYGLLIDAVINCIVEQYGADVWKKVQKKTRLDNDTFNIHTKYNETIIPRIARSLSHIIKKPIDDVMLKFGTYFIHHMGYHGYDKILRILGRNLRDFLNGLDNLHEYVKTTYDRLRPPSFFIENENMTGLDLHYHSRRKGYTHYVRGQIIEIARVFYDIELVCDIISETECDNMSIVKYRLTFDNTAFFMENEDDDEDEDEGDEEEERVVNGETNNTLHKVETLSNNLHNTRRKSGALKFLQDKPINCEQFLELFPFHVIFDNQMEIVNTGVSLNVTIPHLIGERIVDIFTLVRPVVGFTWKNIMQHYNNIFDVVSQAPVGCTDTEPKKDDPDNPKDSLLTALSKQEEHKPDQDVYLQLRGQMLYVEEWSCVIYLGTPVLQNISVMLKASLYINDLSMHDSSRDLVLAGTQQAAELKLALEQEKTKTKTLEDNMEKLNVEMQKTDHLLYQMIPKKIADRLRAGEPVTKLSEVFDNVTILFSDIVSFTKTCSKLKPIDVVSMLNEMYTKFDHCLEQHNVYKVETIGDAYMIVSGAPEVTHNHVEEIINMAFDMLLATTTLINPSTKEPLRIRIGAHSGPVVAGVVGLKMPRYCLFGETVTIAGKMESGGQPMHIHISENAKNLLTSNNFEIIQNNKNVRQKTFFVMGKVTLNGDLFKVPLTDHEIIDTQFLAKKYLGFEVTRPVNSISYRSPLSPGMSPRTSQGTAVSATINTSIEIPNTYQRLSMKGQDLTTRKEKSPSVLSIDIFSKNSNVELRAKLDESENDVIQEQPSNELVTSSNKKNDEFNPFGQLKLNRPNKPIIKVSEIEAEKNNVSVNSPQQSLTPINSASSQSNFLTVNCPKLNLPSEKRLIESKSKNLVNGNIEMNSADSTSLLIQPKVPPNPIDENHSDNNSNHSNENTYRMELKSKSTNNLNEISSEDGNETHAGKKKTSLIDMEKIEIKRSNSKFTVCAKQMSSVCTIS
ncbi:hypothetical protein SNEBB_009371 [Seison nebaliae]|nr:hypothetical protein SNEBB_009371 [Seison nebaliae]